MANCMGRWKNGGTAIAREKMGHCWERIVTDKVGKKCTNGICIAMEVHKRDMHCNVSAQKGYVL